MAEAVMGTGVRETKGRVATCWVGVHSPVLPRSLAQEVQAVLPKPQPRARSPHPQHGLGLVLDI